MRVAVACDGDQVGPHFGRCEKFLMAEVQGANVTVLEWMTCPDHEPGLLPRLMRERGVGCVLAGGAGPRAVTMLEEAGIQFIPGVSGPPAEALAALAQGRLLPGESACDH
jgi:predicted Fe-Mo cluster-binding NifX family protein